MAVSSLDTTFPAVTATWAAGLIAVAADTEHLFVALPVLGFVTLAVIGGFVGWCLMIESGRTDALTTMRSIALLLRRIAMGVGVGIAAWLVWLAVGDAEKGNWLLITGAFSVAPVEMATWGLEKLKALMK